jgi:hypothetical protein
VVFYVFLAFSIFRQNLLYRENKNINWCFHKKETVVQWISDEKIVIIGRELHIFHDP